MDVIPEGGNLKEGTLYVSIPYATTIHRCCCGCGIEVVAPLTPTDWELTFDGESVSLYPSIGNWNFPCQSHYWIRNGRAEWARPMSKYEIEAGRMDDRIAKQKYYGVAGQTRDSSQNESVAKPRIWRRLAALFAPKSPS